MDNNECNDKELEQTEPKPTHKTKTKNNLNHKKENIWHVTLPACDILKVRISRLITSFGEE